MIKLITKRLGVNCITAKLVIDNTSIDLGTLDYDERDALAKECIAMIWAIGPHEMNQFKIWLNTLLREAETGEVGK